MNQPGTGASATGRNRGHQYEADDGALTKAQLSQIKKSAPKAKGGQVRSSLFEMEAAESIALEQKVQRC